MDDRFRGLLNHQAYILIRRAIRLLNDDVDKDALTQLSNKYKPSIPETETADMNICSECNEFKPINEFQVERYFGHGRYPDTKRRLNICIDCFDLRVTYNKIYHKLLNEIEPVHTLHMSDEVAEALFKMCEGCQCKDNCDKYYYRDTDEIPAHLLTCKLFPWIKYVHDNDEMELERINERRVREVINDDYVNLINLFKIFRRKLKTIKNETSKC